MKLITRDAVHQGLVEHTSFAMFIDTFMIGCN
jgi:hypothetical protein